MKLDELPQAFLELQRAGRFDYWGAPRDSLTAEQRRERALSREKLVLWWNKVEWDKTLEQILNHQHDPDGLMRPGLVPFAGDGSGDEYCWYPPWQTLGEPPIVRFCHDDDESELFAQNFSGFLTRCLLREYSSADGEQPDSIESRRPVWDAHLAILRPHLEKEHVALLDDVTAHFSPEASLEAEETFVASLPARSLVTGLAPTDFKRFRGEHTRLLELFDEAIAFWREVVEVEGRMEFQHKLTEVRENRAAAAKGAPPKTKPPTRHS